MTKLKIPFYHFLITGILISHIVSTNSSPLISCSIEEYVAEEDIRELLAVMRTHQFETAMTMSRDLLIMFPGNPRLAAIHGITLARAGNMEAAEKFLQHANTLYPDLPEIRYGLGVLAYSNNDPTTATDHFFAALFSKYFFEDAVRDLLRVVGETGNFDSRQDAVKTCLDRYRTYGKEPPGYLQRKLSSFAAETRDNIFTFPIDHEPVTLPLRKTEISEIRMISIGLNGQGNYPFDIDSAAKGFLTISPLLAEELEIQGYGNMHSVGVGTRSIPTQAAWLDTIELNGLVIRNIPILISKSHTFIGKKKGLIGTAFLKHFNVTLDLARNEMLLMPLNDLQGFLKQINPAAIVLRTPLILYHSTMIDAAIDTGPEQLFILDTAAGTHLLDSSYFDAHLTQYTDATRIKKANITGAGGTESTRFIEESKVRIGGEEFTDQRVVLFGMERLNTIANRYAAGLIGYPILWKYRVHFNFQTPELILEKNL